MHLMPTIFISAGRPRFVPVSFWFRSYFFHAATLPCRPGASFSLITLNWQGWNDGTVERSISGQRITVYRFMVHSSSTKRGYVGGGHFALTGPFRCLSPGNSGFLKRVTIVQILLTSHPIVSLTTPFLPTLPLLDNSQRRSHQLTRSPILQNFRL